MDISFEYDDTQLQKMFAELQPENRLKVMKSAFRRQANKVRKAAINNLRASLNSSRDIERGVRTVLYKKKAAGFRVTVGSKKSRRISAAKWAEMTEAEKEEYRQQVLKKNVPRWAEDGTVDRKTKFRIGRRPRRLGRMKRYGFMAKTKEQVMDNVTNELHEEVRKSVIRIAKKYGCK